MSPRALAIVLVLGACDSAPDKGKSEGKPTPAAKADAKAPPVVDSDKEAELIANAPPEGEIVEAGAKAKPAPEIGATAIEEVASAVSGIHNHEVTLLDGTVTKLDTYKGKALLVVNTASECGYTPQYEDLQSLYSKYRERGFEVLAFPSNDYGAQEPGSRDEIRKFVKETYGVEFPMFDKMVVKGPDKAPLYKSLTEQEGDVGGEVKWNFTKFLVDPQGKVVQRFEPKVKPTDPVLTAALEKVLPKGS